MDGILVFWGKLIDTLSQSAGGMIGGMLLYAALSAFIRFPLSKKSNENILLSGPMREEMLEIQGRHRKNPAKGTQEIQQLFVKYHYGMFASVICTVVQAILVLLPVLAISRGYVSGEASFLGVDLSLSPNVLRTAQAPTPLVSGGAVLLAIGLQLAHDRIMERDLITDQKIQDLVLLAAVAACGIFLPLAFALYWVLFEVLDIVLMLLTVKLGRNAVLSRYSKKTTR